MSIRFENVSRSFGSQLALHEISTTISAGKMVAIMGANGAGKSTFLQLLAGWIPASKGRITLDDFLIKPTRLSVRRRLMMLDEPRRHDAPVLSVIGQAVKDYQVDRENIETEVASWMDQLNMVDTYRKTSRNVSKGQRYKAALISLFAVAPPVWLLDEPFSCGLDAVGLEVMQREMRNHVCGGGTVVFSTQWPEHAARLADQVLVLEEGKLAWDNTPSGEIDEDTMSKASPTLAAVLRGLQGREVANDDVGGA